ncbi:tRNA 2-thiocytidine biosynthesis TtcA family protein [Peptoniphilus sp. KCTC 25270]|uniref:tRNA 2-thiocytidine biosynthesis TtcA family protein n=1 Tax=Peptoniphilus sp. KCTC 25270 TaxID=2897414 RepID=UPI001E31ED08|nr:tRNA 2-thiocytidine biosynthesis TtcA family protein [Peptoniphilus sp. KCTC 25270]MCD1146743.1 tRNA 2-thiocytidine biosynthesis TtcA family protein [Peptoniphilus sp. KCTC 25270]
MDRIKEIERSIIKSYRKDIWKRFVKGINDYEMIEEGDKIAIAISGGKDSLLLAKLFQELLRHGKKDFSLEFICMNPGYRPDIVEQIQYNAKDLGIPMKMYDAPVFRVAEEMGGDRPCYMCARMRRGSLYDKAKQLGCNKLALGHHADDVIETILMNVLFGGNYKTMMPKLHSTNFEGMELIRPMVFIREDDIRRWVKYNGINPIDCACTVTEKKNVGARVYVKNLIQEVKKTNPNVEMSIYRSAENVEMGAILGYKDSQGVHHSFLETYGKEEE